MPVERERKSTVLDIASIHTMRAGQRQSAKATAKQVEQTVTVDPPETTVTAVETPPVDGDPAATTTTRKRA